MQTRFLKKGVSIIIGTLIYKFGFLVKDILLTSKLGISNELTLYLTAYLIPNFLANTFAQALQIGLAHNITENSNQIPFQKIIKVFLYSLIAILILYPVIYFLTPIIFYTENSNEVTSLQNLLFITAPLFLFTPARGAIGQALYQQGHFITNFSLSLITSLSLIIYIYTNNDPTAQGLIGSVALGAIIEFFICFMVGLFLKSISFKNTIDHRPIEKPIHSSILQLLIMLPFIVDQILAHKYSPSFLAIFNYANKVPNIIATLILVYSGSVLLPHFIKTKPVITQIISKKLIVLMAAAYVLSIFIAPHASLLITELLYQRGKFSLEDTMAVSQIQTLYFYSIPLSAFHMSYVRYLNAKHRMNTAITICFFVLLVSGSIGLYFSLNNLSHKIPLSILGSYIVTYSAYSIMKITRMIK